MKTTIVLVGALLVACGGSFQTEVFSDAVDSDAGRGEDSGRAPGAREADARPFETGASGITSDASAAPDARVLDAAREAAAVASRDAARAGGGALVGAGGRLAVAGAGGAPSSGGMVGAGGFSLECVRSTGAVFVCATDETTWYPCPVVPPGCHRAASSSVVCCKAGAP